MVLSPNKTRGEENIREKSYHRDSYRGNAPNHGGLDGLLPGQWSSSIDKHLETVFGRRTSTRIPTFTIARVRRIPATSESCPSSPGAYYL